jgi:hypothetical protein
MITHPYEHIYTQHISMSISKRLSQLDFKNLFFLSHFLLMSGQHVKFINLILSNYIKRLTKDHLS